MQHGNEKRVPYCLGFNNSKPGSLTCSRFDVPRAAILAASLN